EPGAAGLRTWGASVEYRNIRVEGGGRPIAFKPAGEAPKAQVDPGIVVSPDPGHPMQRALEEFCSLLLNLNEFVYVD
ncbi:MAG: hypothetical protein VYC95_01740, partial [Verrucomicrobiota bacterium]|nr:hypothetical protein [Verrucomicrobiota bacterium]